MNDTRVALIDLGRLARSYVTCFIHSEISSKSWRNFQKIIGGSTERNSLIGTSLISYFYDFWRHFPGISIGKSQIDQRKRLRAKSNGREKDLWQSWCLRKDGSFNSSTSSRQHNMKNDPNNQKKRSIDDINLVTLPSSSNNQCRNFLLMFLQACLLATIFVRYPSYRSGPTTKITRQGSSSIHQYKLLPGSGKSLPQHGLIFYVTSQCLLSSMVYAAINSLWLRHRQRPLCYGTRYVSYSSRVTHFWPS